MSRADGHTGKHTKAVHKGIQDMVSDKVAEQINDQLPPGSARVVAVYDRADADKVDKATMKSTDKIDKASAKHLRQELDEAGTGLVGQIDRRWDDAHRDH
jgi:hypothetical protein